MLATGLTKGRISQLLGNGAFGDLTAKRLIGRLVLPEDYFTEPVRPDPLLVRAALAHMDAGQRESFLLELLGGLTIVKKEPKDAEYGRQGTDPNRGANLKRARRKPDAKTKKG
jgi:hypothetical protein